MNFIVYQNSNGKVWWGASCPDQTIAQQEIPEGCSILVTDADPLTSFVQDGGVYSIPPQPDNWHAWDDDTRQWVDTPPAVKLEAQWRVVRAQRDSKIQQTDWTQALDIPEATRNKWVEYRQALRDVTLQLDPFNIVWPNLP